MANSPTLDRRQFVNLVTVVLGTFMGAVIGIPAIGYLLSPAVKLRKSEAWIPLGPLEKYPSGVPTPFNFTRTKVNGWEKTVNSYAVYVYRKPENAEVVVFSNLCTHLSCRVTWKDDLKEYACPCHDGRFNIEGQVVSGPPPRPLVRFETKLENGNLFIHLQES